MAGNKPQRLSTKLRKEQFLETLSKTFGIIAPACQIAQISRKTVYNWKDSDPEFAEAMQNITLDAKDWGEYKLYELMQKNRDAAIIFYNKTKNRDRGYSEVLNIDTGSSSFNLTVETYDLTQEEKDQIVPPYDEAEIVDE